MRTGPTQMPAQPGRQQQVGLYRRFDPAAVHRDRDIHGQSLHREPLVWVSGQGHSVYNENPVPLALLPPGNIYRDAALEALDRIGRPWRLACISESISGLQAAVFAGFAVSVVGKSALVPGMRIIGRPESFPELPEVDVVMHRSAGRQSIAADCLADFVVAGLSNNGPRGAPNAR